MDPIDFLTRNTSMSFDAFKDLFKDKFSIDTLKAAFDAVRNKNPDLSSFVNNIDTSKLGDLAAAVGAVATGVALLKKDNISQLFSSLDGSEGFGDINQELVTMNKLMGVLTLRPTELAANVVQEAFNQATIYLQQQTALVDYMNNKIGLTGELSEHFRDEITKASPEVLRMGVSFEQLAQFSGGLVENTGKFLMLSSQGLVKATETSQAYVGSLSELGEMLPKFVEVGYGFEDATDHIAKIGKDSMEIALRSQTVTKQVGENVGKLNQYGFKNGIDGLGKMVQKSIEFRTNMESTFAIADKTMDITDSINLSAELTALGGAVGDFLDPFKLSYMAVNDVEGLQDALLGMSKSLATYNSETNKYEVTGVNLRLARSQAQALGVDLATLTNSAIAGAERQQVHNDLMARGLTMSKEQQEFITNMSQMKDGSMQLEISDNLAKQLGVKDNSVRIQDLNQQQLDTILKMQDEIKSKDGQDIVRDQATNIGIIQRDLSFMAAIARNSAGKIAVAEAEKEVKNQLIKYGYLKKDESLKDASKNYSNQVAEVTPKSIEEGANKIKRGWDMITNSNNAPNNSNTTPTSQPSVANNSTVNNYSSTPTVKQQITISLNGSNNPNSILHINKIVRNN